MFSKNGVLSVIGVYVVLVTGLWLFQERLIYSPVGDHIGDWGFCEKNDRVEEIRFISADGTPLVGWLARHHDAENTVLMFHGAAENVAMLGKEIVALSEILSANVMVFDYRGFGKSDGYPSEEGVVADGKAALAKLNELTNSQPEDVIVMARSLGGGAATQIAVEQGAKGLVLHSTYTAMDDLCAGKFWFMPVRSLLRTKFPTINWLSQFRGPVFIAHGTQDQLIPFEHATQLFESVNCSHKQFLKQTGKGHHDAVTKPFLAELKRFVDELNQATAKPE